MGGFNRPSIVSTNFQQSNMGRNQGNMGFNNQQPSDSLFGNNRLRDSDMMQSNNQKSMDTVFISNVCIMLTLLISIFLAVCFLI